MFLPFNLLASNCTYAVASSCLHNYRSLSQETSCIIPTKTLGVWSNTNRWQLYECQWFTHSKVLFTLLVSPSVAYCLTLKLDSGVLSNEQTKHNCLKYAVAFCNTTSEYSGNYFYRSFEKKFCIYEKCLNVHLYFRIWLALTCFVLCPPSPLCLLCAQEIFWEKMPLLLHVCLTWMLSYFTLPLNISAFMAWECMPVSLHDTCSCETLQSVCVVSACSLLSTHKG